MSSAGTHPADKNVDVKLAHVGKDIEGDEVVPKFVMPMQTNRTNIRIVVDPPGYS